MVVSLTNQSKNTASPANQAYSDNGLTWDEATSTWDSPTAQASTWDRQATGTTNQAKNTASLSNQAKS